MKGYKAFNKDLQCRDYQFVVGSVFTKEGKLEICSNGFHFCEKSWTLSASFNIKKGSSERQQVLFDALVAGMEVNLAIGEIVSGTLTDGYQGTAVIESFAENNEKDGSVTRDISFVGNGELQKIDAS